MTHFFSENFKFRCLPRHLGYWNGNRRGRILPLVLDLTPHPHARTSTYQQQVYLNRLMRKYEFSALSIGEFVGTSRNTWAGLRWRGEIKYWRNFKASVIEESAVSRAWQQWVWPGLPARFSICGSYASDSERVCSSSDRRGPVSFAFSSVRAGAGPP